jgi:hypothetical protein
MGFREDTLQSPQSPVIDFDELLVRSRDDLEALRLVHRDRLDAVRPNIDPR